MVCRSKGLRITGDAIGGHQDAEIDVAVTQLVDEGHDALAVNWILPVLGFDQEERRKAPQSTESRVMSHGDVHLVAVSEVKGIGLKDDARQASQEIPKESFKGSTPRGVGQALIQAAGRIAHDH